ncbi:hypothetical protein AOQ73_21360 [Bradyrhizobium pachyrhizi]|nr:hypothetical protein AOQ73_21360 [Bradyrhizobium pachyrhizi]
MSEACRGAGSIGRLKLQIAALSRITDGQPPILKKDANKGEKIYGLDAPRPWPPLVDRVPFDIVSMSLFQMLATKWDPEAKPRGE